MMKTDFKEKYFDTEIEMLNPNGSDYINSLIEKAIEDGSRTATVNGGYLIDEAVRIPSNFTLILEDCYLRLADGCYSNIFVNEHHDTEIGRTLAGRDFNISIIGRGSAVLDGGRYNGLSERTQLKDGRPPIWKNNLILFTNVEGFKVSGLSCYNQRWWSLNFIYCAHGHISDMDFHACDIAIAEDGTPYHGLTWDRYEEVLVKNADGVDLRVGCHDIVVENISGFTEDDTIAITGLYGELEQHFAVEGLSSDISGVTVRNVRSSAFCTIVRLLNQSGVRLHDITIDGVYDTSDDCDSLDRGLYAVRVGDTRLYGTRHATKDETYNITIRNIIGRGKYGLSLAGDMQNVVAYGIECRDGCKMLLDERESR